MTEEQVVTISFFKYNTIKSKWWALKQMKKARRQLAGLESLHFHKLLGSGSGNGFSIWPDFSVYALLCVWPSYRVARRAVRNFPVFLNMQARAESQMTVFLQAIRAKGSWNQRQPFRVGTATDPDEPIAVITRASIARNKLLSFWRQVPAVSSKLQKVKGMAFSKGIGEFPLIEQATFSIWQSRKAMADYAYRGKKHREMIKKTHLLNWYSEELFAEFKILNIEQDSPYFNGQILKLRHSAAF